MNYTVYKITNKINSKIYVGCHVTENLNDGYMGSGVNIKKAIKKFGRENFIKEVLYIFDNKEDMLNKEREIVNNEFTKREDVYNIIIGGGELTTLGLAVVRNKDGEYFTVNKEDPRYLSGELTATMDGKSVLKDKDGNIVITEKNDPRYLSGELVGCSKGKVNVIDKYGNVLKISVEDPRYISGELKFNHCWNVFSHTEETKIKMSLAKKGKYNGEKSKFFGMCWITKDGINDRIYKEDLDKMISEGWRRGRDYKNIIIKKPSPKGMNAGEKNSQYGTKWINNGSIDKKIKKSELNTFIENGWILGRVKIKKES